jgi:predicted nucleic acid-binding protein
VGLTLLDSGVLAALLDERDAHHLAAADHIRRAAQRDRLSASTITYAEILTGAHRGRHDTGLARALFDELVLTVWPVDRNVAERAAELRGGRRGLPLPDALIAGTADLHADALITTDTRLSRLAGIRCPIILLQGSQRPRAG